MASIGPAAALSGEQFQLLVQTLDDVYAANLSAVAVTTWLGYDILVTLRQDVELIWRTRWSTVKVLYFIVRYYSFFALMFTVSVVTSQLHCRKWLWFYAFNGTLLSAVLGQAIFLLRLYASFQRNKIVLAVLCIFFTSEAVLAVVTAVLMISSMEITEPPPGIPIPGCVTTPPKYTSLATIAWSWVLFSTCIYFAFILYKFSRNISLRNDEPSGRSVPILQLRRLSPVLFAFLRDSAFYFLLVFGGNVVNLTFNIIFQGRPLMVMATIWVTAIYSISASRLCLNTRSSLQRHFEYDTGWFDDIELTDATAGTHTGSSDRQPNMMPIFASPVPPPAIVVSQNGGKVGLHRQSVSPFRPRSNMRHYRDDSTTRSMGKRLSDGDDYDDYDRELVSVAPWLLLERGYGDGKRSPASLAAMGSRPGSRAFR